MLRGEVGVVDPAEDPALPAGERVAGHPFERFEVAPTRRVLAVAVDIPELAELEVELEEVEAAAGNGRRAQLRNGVGVTPPRERFQLLANREIERPLDPGEREGMARILG